MSPLVFQLLRLLPLDYHRHLNIVITLIIVPLIIMFIIINIILLNINTCVKNCRQNPKFTYQLIINRLKLKKSLYKCLQTNRMKNVNNINQSILYYSIIYKTDMKIFDCSNELCPMYFIFTFSRLLKKENKSLHIRLYNTVYSKHHYL